MAVAAQAQFQVQDVIGLIQKSYSVIDKLQISVTSLVVIGLVLLAVLLITTRELVTWFFKIDSLKKEVRELRSQTTQLENEIKSLGLLIKEQASTQELKPVPENKFDFQINH